MNNINRTNIFDNDLDIDEEIIKFLEELCRVDFRIKIAMRNDKMCSVIKRRIGKSVNSIRKEHKELLPKIKKHVLRYQGMDSNEVKVSDFLGIMEWFDMSVNDKESKEDYWNPKGQYIDLRLNEVINFYLMARDL